MSLQSPQLVERPPQEAMDDRVLELRRAIARGEYVVDARLVAERLIAAGVLRRAAKA